VLLLSNFTFNFKELNAFQLKGMRAY